ncbi:MAG: hypothetical protein K0U74_09115 [Alphaproteobacteria bacterium]|nr:hypothetical protein [Alphaproteobacteria bacterium]
MTITVGLDVGGAHLKVARLEDGLPVAVRQYLCPLWKGIDHLNAALDAAAGDVRFADQIAVTMTGELSDLFQSRDEGVTALVDLLSAKLEGELRFYLGGSGFGSCEEAKKRPDQTGSMNFLATCEAVAGMAGEALLIDFGSTTVDIIAISGGIAQPRGLTDLERQANGELIYTGLTRTAVMGVAQSAPLKGRYVGLAREYLATMADVRRVMAVDLGVDLGALDVHDSADGRGKTLEESTIRLARMFGCDVEMGSQSDWRTAAAFIREAQLRSIMDGAFQVSSAHALSDEALVVTAGIGAGEAAEVGRRLYRRSVSFGALAGLTGDIQIAATHHAPAVAVALLLEGSR